MPQHSPGASVPQADCVTMSFCPPSASPNGEAGEALAEESRLHNSLVNQILHGVYPERFYRFFPRPGGGRMTESEGFRMTKSGVFTIVTQPQGGVYSAGRNSDAKDSSSAGQPVIFI